MEEKRKSRIGRVVNNRMDKTVVVEVEKTVVVEPTPVPVEELVTLDINYGTDIAGLDPQRAEDVISINSIESLFVGLTDYDDATGAVLPELATEWEQVINEDGTAGETEVFASGWLDDETGEYLGRPVDVAQLPDGSIIVSDDFAGAVYRIWYEG
jgi:ABC-type transport system substrate-binding protein